MATSPVLPNGSPAATSPKGDESKAYRDEIASLRKTNNELAASEGYWKGVADGGWPSLSTVARG